MKALPPVDLLALLFTVFCWVAYSRYTLKAAALRPSLMSAMQQQRLRWMRQMVLRENRITDATIVGNQVRGVTFFASTTVLIIAALVSLLATSENIVAILAFMPTPHTVAAIDMKVAVLIVFMTYAFFRFTWSLRQFKFLGVIIGAAPLHTAEQTLREKCALKAATLADAGSYAFNGGLRTYYFSLATLAWFIHPLVMMAATVAVLTVLYHREFHSAAVLGLND